jgi:hypothetical protein
MPKRVWSDDERKDFIGKYTRYEHVAPGLSRDDVLKQIAAEYFAQYKSDLDLGFNGEWPPELRKERMKVLLCSGNFCTVS